MTGSRWKKLLLAAAVVAGAYYGPAGCLRADPSEADSAEARAAEAELVAASPPLLTADEAETRMDALLSEFEVWDPGAGFWSGFLPEPPDGLHLASLVRGEPEPVTVQGAHTRSLSFGLALSVCESSEGDEPCELVPAPGGSDATLAWLLNLNDRTDMRLAGFVLRSDGSADSTWTIWLRDTAPEPDDGAVDGAADDGDG